MTTGCVVGERRSTGEAAGARSTRTMAPRTLRYMTMSWMSPRSQEGYYIGHISEKKKYIYIGPIVSPVLSHCQWHNVTVPHL